MRVLIINPPDKHTIIENPAEDGKQFLEADDYGEFPPLGALYVYSWLDAKTSGHQLFFKDCVGERSSYQQLKTYLEEVRPDVVGITSFTICLVDVIKTARMVREINPDVHICLGGHHPTAYPELATKLPDFDSVVVGEGESAFTELVTALDKGEDFTHIRGVYTEESIKRFQDAEPIRDRRFLAKITVPPAYIEDIDSIPMLNRDPISHIVYNNILGHTKELATLLRTRGCPFKCTFCDVPFKEYRARSTKLVVDEIEACLAMGYKEIRFYDDLFNMRAQDIINFCDEIDSRGLKFPWDFRGRVSGLSRESLQRAKNSGLRMISFGVETGSDMGLKRLKKGIKSSQVQQAFQWCREFGIISVADFIIGFPFEENPDQVRQNLKFLFDLDPDYAQINVLKLYPHTALYDEAIEKGVVKPGRWEEYALNPRQDFVIDHWEEHMSLETQVKLQQWAYRRFYFRPKYIWRSLLQTRSLYELLSKAGGALKLVKNG